MTHDCGTEECRRRWVEWTEGIADLLRAFTMDANPDLLPGVQWAANFLYPQNRNKSHPLEKAMAQNEFQELIEQAPTSPDKVEPMQLERGEWVFKPDRHFCFKPDTSEGNVGDVWRCGECQMLWRIERFPDFEKDWSLLSRWQRFKLRKYLR